MADTVPLPETRLKDGFTIGGYTAADMHSHAAAVSAADNASLREERDELLRDNRRKIGALARYRIEAQIADQLLDEGPDTETTALDMEYWHTQHDKIQAALQRIKVLEQAVQHYEAALKARWPEGAMGESFGHWNSARAALEQKP
jgi:hypothetical protein